MTLLLLFASERARAQSPDHAHVQLLGFNDFHGQLGGGRQLLDRPVGSAAVLAAYLRDESARFAGGTLIVHAGDFVGGSPLSSSLLQDEPAIAFLNLLANSHCRGGEKPDPRCNVVGTLGNHEFDEGVGELMRLLRGGNAAEGPYLERPYAGARIPYVCANLVDSRHGRPILPSYVIQRVDGVRVALIGAVLTLTQDIVLAEGLRGVRFVDESDAINRAVGQVRKRGVEAIVVLLHQGAGMIPYDGPTRPEARLPPESAIAEIVGKLDPAVDVVVSGHAHQFSNALAPREDGRTTLITQAHSAGMAYADIELTIDRKSGEVIEKSARILTTYADQGPGLKPAADVAALTEAAEAEANTRLAQVVGHAPEPVSATPNQAGESALGNLITDAQRKATGAQIALANQGTIRGDLARGPIPFRALLAIHPFGSVLVTMELTGAQLRRVLEQQFAYTPPHILQVSGLSYRWDAMLPVGKRVLAVRVAGRPLSDQATYRVAMSDFLARGGGGFTTLTAGKKRVVGPRDTDALRAYLDASQGRAKARIEGRIIRRE